jgi:formylglycine-generating enzyme required for sulfatase activity
MRRSALITAFVASALVASLAAARAPARKRRAKTRSKRVTLVTPAPSEVLIRGGVFRMGSTIPEIAVAQALCRFEPLGRECKDQLFGDEMIVREVILDDFWIDTHEVTNESYRRCVDAGVCTAPAFQAAAVWTGNPRHPVTLVSWYDADRYCRWRKARLPTEAEWERAAKGWSGRVYPWGDVFNPKIVNHGRFAINQLNDVDGFAELAPVGSFPQGRTPEGVYDLAGNAEEWVADWYHPIYSETDLVNPTGPEAGDERVSRGGSYLDGRGWVRAGARGHDLPSMRRPFRGFRCARDATAAKKRAPVEKKKKKKKKTRRRRHKP